MFPPFSKIVAGPAHCFQYTPRRPLRKSICSVARYDYLTVHMYTTENTSPLWGWVQKGLTEYSGCTHVFAFSGKIPPLV